MKLLAAVVLLLAGAASGSTPIQRQSAAVDHACHATVAAVQQAVSGAANAQVRTISSHLQVVIPGRVTGAIVFNASGWSIDVGAPPTQGPSFGCGEATGGHGRGHGAGRSQVVAVLRARFTRSGRRVLRFTLDGAGRRILARLGAQESAYVKHHRRGQPAPTIAFGAALSYAPAR